MISLNPLVLLLGLVLIGVFVWRGWMLFNAPSPPGAYGRGVHAGAMAAVVIGPLLCLAVAGGVGALLYFACRRSEAAAHAGAGVVLLIACGLFGWSNYAMMMRLGKGPGAPVAVAGPSAPAVASAQQILGEQRARMEAQSQAARELAKRLREPPGPAAARSPAPASPTPSAADPASTSTSTPTPRAAPRVDNERAAKDLAMETALAPVRRTLEEAVDSALVVVAPALDAVTSPPKADIRDVRARIESLTGARGTLSELSVKLRSAQQQAASALANAGELSEVERSIAATKFEVDFGAARRAMSADALLRTLDQAKSEAEILRDAIGRWKLEGGKVTSKDRALEGRVRSVRFMLDADLTRREQTMDGIRGR